MSHKPFTGGCRLGSVSALLCMVSATSATWAANAPPLADLSLEELATISITSVSRRAEPLSEAAASVFVITAQAIRDAGAVTLPQALRLAPNLQVAQVNASQFAISARGFNNAIGNKLLVLIDGRTVYTPFFSGVFWDQQDVMVEDIERIEVISGPGATLWGSNAVNGVINVITRSSADTQGALVSAGGGNKQERLAARYGGTLGEAGHFRIYGKRTRLDNTQTADGSRVPDGWVHQQAGFRTDWTRGADTVRLQGDVYKGESEPLFFGPINLGPVEAEGANLLARWQHRIDDGSSLRIQTYFDSTKRIDPLLFRPEVDVFDFEIEHAVQLGPHALIWGGGYRRASDDVQPGLFFGFQPPQRTLSWKNLFVQGDIHWSDTLELTLGTKLEHNDFTGTEYLPSARLGWKLAPEHHVWAAVSRAVRAPARLDRDIRLPPTPPFIIAGGPDFISEVANVLEVGWRAQPSRTLTYSITAFYNDWDRLRSGQLPPNAMVQNMIEGHTQGLEAWGTWQVLPAWRLNAGATVLRENLRLKPGSADPVGPSALGNDPRHQWTLRSAFDLSDAQQLEVGMRRVGALPNPVLPAYTAVDVRYSWRPRNDLMLSITGLNLDGGHAEFGAATTRSEVPRSVFVQLTWTP